MKKIVFSLMLVFAVSSVFAQKSGFKRLISDRTKSGKAILAVSSDEIGVFMIKKGQKVYEPPGSPLGKYCEEVVDRKKGTITVTKVVFYFYVEPGEYVYPNYRTSDNFREIYAGKYSLEADKVYYFGHINLRRANNNPEGYTSNVEMSAEILEAFKEKIKKDLPRVYNSVNGNIEQVVFNN